MQVASPNSALLASIPADVRQAIFTRSAESLNLVLKNLDYPELYKQYHRLRLVCKHFNSLFEQHSAVRGYLVALRLPCRLLTQPV